MKLKEVDPRLESVFRFDELPELLYAWPEEEMDVRDPNTWDKYKRGRFEVLETKLGAFYSKVIDIIIGTFTIESSDSVPIQNDSCCKITKLDHTQRKPNPREPGSMKFQKAR